MKILTPAKVNLFLDVGKKDASFHKIASLVDIVDFCDEIEIQESDETRVEFVSRWKIPPINTVSESIRLLKPYCCKEFNAEIKIFKKIPPGSGLGGGSSNAAGLLSGLNILWNLNLPVSVLSKIGAKIGKDVPVFFNKGFSLVEGYGEKVSCLGLNKKLYYLVHIPEYSVSTKRVYDFYDGLKRFSDLTESAKKIKILYRALLRGDINAIESSMQNSLQLPYFELYPAAKEVSGLFSEKTGKKVFVSGSGGTLFSVFLSRREAEQRLQKASFEGWKSYVLETITS